MTERERERNYLLLVSLAPTRSGIQSDALMLTPLYVKEVTPLPSNVSKSCVIPQFVGSAKHVTIHSASADQVIVTGVLPRKGL